MNDPLLNPPLVQTSAENLAAGTQQFRSQVGHISRNSGVYFAGTIFSVALGYVFKVYLARVLGAEALGIYALGITLIGFVGIFNTLGLPQSAVRFVAAYQAAGKFKELHALLWRGAGLLLAANVVLAAVLLTFGRFLAIRFYHSPALVQYLPLFALMMLFSVLARFYGKVLAGYRDYAVENVDCEFCRQPAKHARGRPADHHGNGSSRLSLGADSERSVGLSNVADCRAAVHAGGSAILRATRFALPRRRCGLSPGPCWALAFSSSLWRRSIRLRWVSTAGRARWGSTQWRRL